jgi:hypothetical protein
MLLKNVKFYSFQNRIKGRTELRSKEKMRKKKRKKEKHSLRLDLHGYSV